ncbi:cytochrome P450 [Pilimelia columellifera]|uniref:Cytochrome P450 n=1 Tax=Pilimelia columellifera subsp. columellifera TaxID=706583 RepID=A0ABN3N9F9_9ACTN
MSSLREHQDPTLSPGATRGAAGPARGAEAVGESGPALARPRPARTLLAAVRPDVRADLYGFYDQLRERGPCYWDRPLRSWVVTSYELASALAGDPRLSSVRYPDLAAAPAPLRPVARVLSHQMIYVDAPAHPRMRGTVSRAFTARAIATLRPRVSALVAELIDAVAPTGRMDLVAEFAEPLPARVVCDLLEVPPADREQVVAWSRSLATVIGSANASPPEALAAADAVERLFAYFDRRFATRPADADGPLSALLSAAAADRLSTDELLANTLLLLVGGHETTTHFIGCAMLALFRHPAERARLAERPALLPAAVEELMRYDPPAQLLLRRATADLDLGGNRVAAGQPILIVVGAVNRDPAAFTEPHRLDLDRGDARHLTFGHGAHFCLGAPLARLEGAIALGELLRRLPDIRLATEDLAWLPSLDFRGLRSLPVSFTPAPVRLPVVE